jgi:hypothetical protein
MRTELFSNGITESSQVIASRGVEGADTVWLRAKERGHLLPVGEAPGDGGEIGE